MKHKTFSFLIFHILFSVRFFSFYYYTSLDRLDTLDKLAWKDILEEFVLFY